MNHSKKWKKRKCLEFVLLLWSSSWNWKLNLALSIPLFFILIRRAKAIFWGLTVISSNKTINFSILSISLSWSVDFDFGHFSRALYIFEELPTKIWEFFELPSGVATIFCLYKGISQKYKGKNIVLDHFCSHFS